MRTSFHHQPEAQHPDPSAINKLPADYPIYRGNSGHWGPGGDFKKRLNEATATPAWPSFAKHALFWKNRSPC